VVAIRRSLATSRAMEDTFGRESGSQVPAEMKYAFGEAAHILEGVVIGLNPRRDDAAPAFDQSRRHRSYGEKKGKPEQRIFYSS